MIHHGDCIEAMRAMPETSVDSIVTDPPYGLGFMGKAWDDLPPGEEWARECLRVLKPGGHLLAFGGTRTWHRLAVAIEDAGFEIRDSIAWMHGQGFPKGKATLKPAHEPIVVARKKPAAARTGLLNIDACRLPTTQADRDLMESRSHPNGTRAGASGGTVLNIGDKPEGFTAHPAPAGRWPANVVLDESQAAALDEQSGVTTSGTHAPHHRRTKLGGNGQTHGVMMGVTGASFADSGGASRFFYVAKASKRERPTVDGTAHPTVKPLALMRWLVRLVTPAGGIVLDPFAGSGTTIEAALLEGMNPIGIEREAEYLPLIHARIARTAEQLPA